jgi:hypothetical protein
MFFDVQKCPSTHHVLPAIDHKLTSKKPRSARKFSQNPLQKHHSTTDKKNPVRSGKI